MRYPVIHQHDATDCGPAVLAMIAAHHKKRISIARLRELAGTDGQGTNLAGLSAAAEHVGFKPRAVRSSSEGLKQIPLPAVAHWREDNRNHFVVLYRLASKHVVIGDPAFGLRKLSHEEFLKKWTGLLLLLTPCAGLRDIVTSESSFSRLCTLLLPHSRLFLDALAAAVLMTVLGLTSSFFIQALVDFVFVLGRKPALNWLGLGMLLVTLARAGFFGLRSHLVAHLSHRIEAETIPGLHRHLPGLPFTLLSISITGSVMLWLNWELTLRSLQLIPALVGIVWLLNKRMANGVYVATVSHFVAGASSLGLLWFGGHQVLKGQLSLGQLLALHTMLATILGPHEQFA